MANAVNYNDIAHFLASAVPIVVLIWLMAKKKGWPSYIALPAIAVVILLLQMFYWQNTKLTIWASVAAALVSTLVPVSIIFGAILFNRFMESVGAIAVIKRWLSSITPNPTAQLMIIGWAFAFMIEGASGFGTPAAIAAPLLVSLGFRAIPVCILTLVMNSVPVSFGAVGTPTWFGFTGLHFASIPGGVDAKDMFLTLVGAKTAIIHAVASLIIPLIALRFVVSWKEIRKNLLYIYLSVGSCIVPYLIIAQFNNELPSLVGGAIGLLLSVFIAKFGIGIAKDFNVKECQMGQEEGEAGERSHLEHDAVEHLGRCMSVFKALFPFILLVGILVVTRVHQWGLKGLLSSKAPWFDFDVFGLFHLHVTQSLTFQFTDIFGSHIGASYALLYVPSLIPFVVTVWICSLFYKRQGEHTLYDVFFKSFWSVRLTYLALFGAFVMVNLMKLGDTSAAIPSMVTVIGERFSSSFGHAWVYFASYLGAIGAFFSGSNTVSNLTFGGIQQSIAIAEHVNQSTMLALQSVGGAMGNMVCLNNIIAVCTVTGCLAHEGYIIKRTAIPMFIYGVVAAVVAVVMFAVLPGTWYEPQVVSNAAAQVSMMGHSVQGALAQAVALL